MSAVSDFLGGVVADSLGVPDPTTVTAAVDLLSNTQPVWFTDWVADVHLKSGIVTRLPMDKDLLGHATAGFFAVPLGGEHQLCARYDTNPGTRDDNSRFELAPFTVRLHDATFNEAGSIFAFVTGIPDGWLDQPEQPWTGTSAVVASINKVVRSADPFTEGITAGEATAGFSLPWWVFGIAAVVGYGALVQVGVVPPLRKLLDGKA